MRFVRVLAAPVLVAFAGTSGAAFAGDAACTWNKLPAPVKAAGLEAGLEGGPAALGAAIGPVEMQRAEKTCGLTDANENAFHRAEAGYMLQLLAEQWLLLHANLSREQLSSAWVKMPRADKAPMMAWAASLEHNPTGYDKPYLGFLKALGVVESKLPEDTKPKVLTYLQGRSLRALFESKY